MDGWGFIKLAPAINERDIVGTGEAGGEYGWPHRVGGWMGGWVGVSGWGVRGVGGGGGVG